MESKQSDNNQSSDQTTAQNNSAGPLERKNFMKPQFENALEKREKFAVNLRKKKTQDIVKAKRRKILDSLGSKSKNGALNAEGQFEIKNEGDLTLQEMENQYYQGYPQWRLNKYQDQKDLLDKMSTPESWQLFHKGTSTEKVQFLLNLIIQSHNEVIQQLAIITKVRQILADGEEAPKISEIINQTSVLNIISQVLGADDGTELTRYLKLEATWILTNLAYGTEQDLALVLDGKFAIINHINRILEGNDLQMIDQVIWFVANTCGESLNLRNLILTQTQIVKALTRIISDAQRMNASIRKGLLKSIIWCVCNICRCKRDAFSNQIIANGQVQMHQLSMEEYQSVLYIITTFIDCKEMSRSMIDAMWALAYIAENADDMFITQICQSQSLIDAVINYLKSPLQEEQVPALRATGNILATSNQENVDIFIFHKGLDALSQLMQEVMVSYNYPSQVLKEICWSLSNVTAGSNENVESFFTHPKLIDQVYKCMRHETIEIRREATYVMTNAITTTDNANMLVFITQYNKGEIIQIFADNLKLNDVNIILEIIQSLGCLLKLDKTVPYEGEEQIAYKFEIAKGLEELENLQKHPNQNIYDAVEQLISNNFESESDNNMVYQDEQQQNQQNVYQNQNVNQININGGPGGSQSQSNDTNMFQI